MPQVSILIPAYNVGPYLAETLDSVMGQTWTDWEAIVVDDCSTDNTWAVAQDYAARDARIQAVRNRQNLGMLGNWNHGISLCNAPYFVKLDADDIWHPQMLEKAVAILETHPGVGLVFSRYINIDERGHELAGTDVPLPDFAAGKAFSCVPLVRQGPGRMLSYAILKQGLSVMRRDIFDRIGMYRYLLTKDTQASTDTEFYFRLGAHYDIYCIDEVLYRYRIHAASISATDTASQLSDQKIYEIKHSIISYYTEQGLLPAGTGKKYLEEVQTTYDLLRTAFHRNNGDHRRALGIISRRFLISPISVFSFYLNRITQKLSGRG